MSDREKLEQDNLKLARENQNLKNQIKELLKAESRLYHLQENLDRQRKLYYELSGFVHNVNSLRSQEEVLAGAVQFLVNTMGYEKAAALAVRSKSEGEYYLQPLALEGYYEQQNMQELLGHTRNIPPEWLKKFQEQRILCQQGDQALLADYLSMDEYLLACLEDNRETVQLLILAGNRQVRQEYFTPVKEDNIPASIFSSLAGHVANALNKLESFQTIENEQKLLSSALAELRSSHAQLEQNYRDLRLTRSHFASVSRRVGRAEIVADILHSLGNLLNSFYVTLNTMHHLRDFRGVIDSFQKISQLLETSDPREIVKKRELIVDYLDKWKGMFLKAESIAGDEIGKLTRFANSMRSFLRRMDRNTNLYKLEENCTLDEVVHEVLALLDFNTGKIDVQVESEELPPLYLDKHKLVQILYELLSNARQACRLSQREEKKILVSAGRQESELCIRIIDNGCGLEPERCQELLADHEAGENLGLHMCVNFIQMLGGEISCSSEGKGRGAAFQIRLPASVFREKP